MRFVTPSILSMLSIGLYAIVDAMFIARYAGAQALAAVSIIMPLLNVFFGFGVMVAAGSSALIGIEIGRGRLDAANRLFSFVVAVLIVIMATAIVTASIVGFDSISPLLGASAELVPYCTAYLEIFIYGIAAVLLPYCFEFFMRLDGKPGWALCSTFLGGLTNVALDYVFIARMGMGIRGAGLASTLGIFASLFLGLFYFLYKADMLRFTVPKPDFRFLVRTMVNGSSEMVAEVSVGVRTLAFNLVMIRLAGEVGVAAMAIFMYMNFLLATLHIGLSMGISPLVSVNYGALNFVKIRETLKYAAATCLVVTLCAFGAAMFAGETIIKLFAGNQREVAALAMGGIAIFAFAFLFNGVNLLSSGFFTAVGNGKISALIAFANTFVFTLSYLFILPRLFDLTGVWLTVPLAELSTACLSAFILYKYRRLYIVPGKPQSSASTRGPGL